MLTVKEESRLICTLRPSTKCYIALYDIYLPPLFFLSLKEEEEEQK